MDPHTIAQQRCLYHPGREAVAKCPECGSFFCRECVTEHEDRVLCTKCLKKSASGGAARSLRRPMIGATIRLLIGLFIVWTFFYYVGRGLLLIPSSFHEGTLWEKSWWEGS